jgi:hypothetical protein
MTRGNMETIELKKMFRKFKVLTLNQISETWECSIRTVQRRLAALSIIRSYNKNSRYYTLPDIAEFNIHGIWSYQDILFSKYGNLRKTVRHLIFDSECGLSGNEIGDIVKLLPRSFMHHFQEMNGVFREKHDGIYVYFSDDPTVYAKQSSRRIQACDAKKISDAIAVKILVGYIKHPELSTEELSIFLRRESCFVSPSMITNLLSFHGLLKKTPDFRL